MRWHKKSHIHGETRIRKGFLLFPKCINDEWRWLEKAEWKQRSYLTWDNSYAWEDIEWVN